MNRRRGFRVFRIIALVVGLTVGLYALIWGLFMLEIFITSGKLEALLTGKKLEKPEFVEYVEIEGTCKEDHAIVEEEYEGSIVHWLYVSENRHDLYGSVQRKDLFSDIGDLSNIATAMAVVGKKPHQIATNLGVNVATVKEWLEKRGTYQPPDIINFNDIRVEDLLGDKLILTGLSNLYESCCSFKTTCQLIVMGREDSLPPHGEVRTQLR